MLFFATARELTSKGNESLSMKEGASLEELEAALVRLHPELKKLAGSTRFSVNMEVADRAVRLKDGDEVGVLPPVAGG